MSQNNKLSVFDFQAMELTAIIDSNKEVWFKGYDVASILGYSNREKSIRVHVDDEDKISLDKIKMNETMPAHFGTPQKIQAHTIFINESGLYSLILRSKLEGAKKFKRWVTKEVLPTLRKNGSYQIPQVKSNPDKLREIQLREAQIIPTIQDAKLKQLFMDRLMNEMQNEKVLTNGEINKWSRDIVTLAKEELGKNINFSEASKLGKFIKKLFVTKYERQPSKYSKFVNGNNRLVFAYEKEYESDLIKWIKQYYSWQELEQELSD